MACRFRVRLKAVHCIPLVVSIGCYLCLEMDKRKMVALVLFCFPLPRKVQRVDTRSLGTASALIFSLEYGAVHPGILSAEGH